MRLPERMGDGRKPLISGPRLIESFQMASGCGRAPPAMPRSSATLQQHPDAGYQCEWTTTRPNITIGRGRSREHHIR